jgi:AraC-like DNA-binding protein
MSSLTGYQLYDIDAQPAGLTGAGRLPSFHWTSLKENIAAINSHYVLPKRQQEHHILWMNKGTGSLLLDDLRLTLHTHTAFHILPNQVMQLSLAPATAGYLLRFTPGFLEPAPNKINLLYYHHQLSRTIISFTHKTATELNQVIAAMEQPFLQPAGLGMDILREYLDIVLLYLSQEGTTYRKQFDTTPRAGIVNRFFELLQENFSAKKQVTEYAREMAISANYLNNIIKKNSGYSASYHIQQQIIQEARRQAIYTTRNMKEIAYHLGFDEYTHFSKFFKKMEGISFTEYRKALAAQQPTLPSCYT